MTGRGGFLGARQALMSDLLLGCRIVFCPVFLSKSWFGVSHAYHNLTSQEPLNAPFLNGLFSSGFSRGKTAPWDEIGETPH